MELKIISGGMALIKLLLKKTGILNTAWDEREGKDNIHFNVFN